MADPVSPTTKPTAAQVNAAAAKWCRDKDRETDMDDVRYFKGQWRSLPGLRIYVEREVAGYAE